MKVGDYRCDKPALRLLDQENVQGDEASAVKRFLVTVPDITRFPF